MVPPSPTSTSWMHRYDLYNAQSQPSYHHRRRQQKLRWAHRLTLDRLCNQQGRSDHYYGDGTKVVYRQREDWSKPQGYEACAILNHERVVGWDRSGALDIIRLPEFSTTAKRKLGTTVVEALDLRLISPGQSPGIPKLFPFHSGDAVVIGCGGNYSIVTSERIKWWGEKRKLSRANLGHPLCSIYTLSGPRRKYKRNLHLPEYSLSAMAQTTCLSSQPLLDYDIILETLPDWNVALPKVPPPMYVPPSRRPIPQSSQWDFWETGSSLLAARIDPQQDAFWIRLMDDRNVYEPVVSVNTTTKTSPMSVPSHRDGYRWEDHMTAMAFVSSHCLLTAHVNCQIKLDCIPQRVSPNTADTSGTSGHATETTMKLWDLRKASTLVRRREKDPSALLTLSLPAFPQDMALAMDHEPIIPSYGQYLDSKRQEAAVVITLSASGNGTVMVTSQIHQVVDHHLFHVGRLSWEHIHSQQDNQESLLYSSAGNHSVLATVESPNDITLLDIWSGPTTKSSLSCDRVKRHVDGRIKEERIEALHNRKLPTHLKDRLGLDTQLSCLAMNSDGTSILGGSKDGDLFIWRSD